MRSHNSPSLLMSSFDKVGRGPCIYSKQLQQVTVTIVQVDSVEVRNTKVIERLIPVGQLGSPNS